MTSEYVGAENKHQVGEAVSKRNANASRCVSLGQRFMGDVHYMAAAQTKSPHLPSLICLSLSLYPPPPPPHDPVAAVPALPRMLHLPKKTLNQGCVEQINQSYITPTNRHSGRFYVRGRWPVQEGRLPEICAESPFNPETHDFMGLGALPGLFRQGLSEFKRLGLLADLRDGECAKDHHGLPVPDRKSKTAISSAAWAGFRAAPWRTSSVDTEQAGHTSEFIIQMIWWSSLTLHLKQWQSKTKILHYLRKNKKQSANQVKGWLVSANEGYRSKSVNMEDVWGLFAYLNNCRYYI